MHANENYAPEPMPSRGSRSVRKKTKGSIVGQLTFGELTGQGKCLQFESKLEHDVAILSIYAPGVIDVIDQVGPITFVSATGRHRKHTLDFVVTRVTARNTHFRTGLVVKPQDRADRAAFRDEVERVTRAAVPTFVDQVCVVTEQNVNKQALVRTSQLHGARFPDLTIDPILEAAILIAEATSIRELLASVGLGPEGFSGVLRLIIRGKLLVEAGALITLSSLVKPTGVAS